VPQNRSVRREEKKLAPTGNQFRTLGRPASSQSFGFKYEVFLQLLLKALPIESEQNLYTFLDRHPQAKHNYFVLRTITLNVIFARIASFTHLFCVVF
jgi:hypothetical protein